VAVGEADGCLGVRGWTGREVTVIGEIEHTCQVLKTWQEGALPTEGAFGNGLHEAR
jgi:hypothetical protein